MTVQSCTVTIDGEKRRYAKGTTYREIAEEYQSRYAHQIVLVFVDQLRLQELTKTLQKDSSLTFVTTEDEIGHATYVRSLCFLLVKALYDTAGHDKIERVRIHFSLGSGYYCTVNGDVETDSAFLEKVSQRMRELSEEALPIRKRSIHTDEAVERFHRHGMYDKEELFKYRRSSRVNLYRMGGFEDYNYGYMVPSTGYLKYFELYLYDEGFVIQMPRMTDTRTVPPLRVREKLFQVQKESMKWGDLQDIETVGDLNREIVREGAQNMVLVQEAQQEKKIAEIAENIAQKDNVKFVLVAGPSSSGKTTFSHRLSVLVISYVCLTRILLTRNTFTIGCNLLPSLKAFLKVKSPFLVILATIKADATGIIVINA